MSFSNLNLKNFLKISKHIPNFLDFSQIFAEKFDKNLKNFEKLQNFHSNYFNIEICLKTFAKDSSKFPKLSWRLKDFCCPDVRKRYIKKLKNYRVAKFFKFLIILFLFFKKFWKLLESFAKIFRQKFQFWNNLNGNFAIYHKFFNFYRSFRRKFGKNLENLEYALKS